MAQKSAAKKSKDAKPKDETPPAKAEKAAEKTPKAVEKDTDKAAYRPAAKAPKKPAPPKDPRDVPKKAPDPLAGVPPPPSKTAQRHLRAPIEIRVEITARNQSFTTTSRNIALGGISFESQQQFRVGDLVNVLLYIPVRKELELLKCASEIVWVEDLSGSWMCGGAFRKFAPGDERRLREWLLESVKAQRAGLALSLPSNEDNDDAD